MQSANRVRPLADGAPTQVVMSKIFEWYSDDFVAFTKQRAKLKEAGVVDFALLYATDPLAAKLKEAKSRSYTPSEELLKEK